MVVSGKVTKFSLIFYVSLLALLMSIVESGVMTSLFAYIGNEFHLNDEGMVTSRLVVFHPLECAMAMTLSLSFSLCDRKQYSDLCSVLNHRVVGTVSNGIPLCFLQAVIR